MTKLPMTIYALDGREVVTFDDAIEYAKWLGERPDYDPHVGSSYVGEFWVSTVLLIAPMRHFFSDWGDEPPLIFETMLFDEKGNVADVMGRYATYDEAERKHQALVDMLQVKVKEGFEITSAFVLIMRGALQHI